MCLKHLSLTTFVCSNSHFIIEIILCCIKSLFRFRVLGIKCVEYFTRRPTVGCYSQKEP